MKIERPIVDCKLYRYRSASGERLNYLLDEIKNGEIFLADPKSFNDPFETVYKKEDFSDEKFLYKRLCSSFVAITGQYSMYGVLSDIIAEKFPNKRKISLDEFVKISSKYAKKYIPEFKKSVYINKLIKLNKDQIKVSKIDNLYMGSFSEMCTSIPMWAYYADSHKGVCLEYDFACLEKDSEIYNNIYKVSYSSNIPENKFLRVYSPIVKGIEWAHENEWRYIYSENDSNVIEKDGKKYLKLPILKKIIVGCNASSETIAKIFDVVLKNGMFSHVKITIMVPESDKFSLREDIYMGTLNND